MNKCTLLLFVLAISVKSLAQNAGVNTQTPHPSASLDVVSNSKGVLLPKVLLLSSTDQSTIPNPAKSLLVYKPANAFGSEGLYYNLGDADNPLWQMLGSRLNLPLSFTDTNAGALFYVENTSSSSLATGIEGYSETKRGVGGATVSGSGVAGLAFGSGTGFQAINTATGLALDVSGKLRISGTGQSPGVGKILTSDSDGDASWQEPVVETVAFSATGVKGDGTIGTQEKVKFLVEHYDIGNSYNAVFTNHFTAPFHGIYHFDALLQYASDVNLEFFPITQIMRTRNSITTILAEDEPGEARFSYTSQVSIECELLPGDIIFVQGSNGHLDNDPQAKLVTSDYAAFFNGRMIQKL
ncbi:complement C1q domain-containing protein [Dyadobacter sp. LJ53]|uniref:complement C1q domain-containing protein n=1 Tax=Dyadobacter chenwenxiniae TaxID=2906456 RepID=UPI001F2CBADB|nr:complement C1q domain-containing protein [Dyadobacter chenwenxiniae]MCF0050560.1 complement C1q domain-containing protein [Dyadobacter chenwenxiniae]